MYFFNYRENLIVITWESQIVLMPKQFPQTQRKFKTADINLRAILSIEDDLRMKK